MKNKITQLLLLLFIINTPLSLFSYRLEDLEKVINFVQSDRNDRDLRFLDLTHAPLKGYDLSGGNFIGSDFTGALLIDTIWDNPEYNNDEKGHTFLSGTTLNHARMDRAKLNNILMLNIEAHGTIFNNAQIKNSNLKNSDFTNAKFKQAKIYESNIEEITIDNANFSNAKFKKTNLGKIESQNNTTFSGAKYIEIINIPQDAASFLRCKITIDLEISMDKAIQIYSLTESLNSIALFGNLFRNFQQQFNEDTEETSIEKRNFLNEYLPLPSKIYTEERCPICLEDFEDCTHIGILSCGHTFHQACINESLNNQANKCPTCGCYGMLGFREILYTK